MPYIAGSDRPNLNAHIEALADEIKKTAGVYGYDGAFAGILNYAITTLILKTIPTKRYWVIALVGGVLSNVADEFYRRFAAPYEDAQIVKNGDVDGYGPGNG